MDLWRVFPAYDTGDYDAFKERIIEVYPGADKQAQYTIHDLDRIVQAYADLEICTETEFMEFAHHFLPVATWLVKQNRISQMDLDKKFWQGLSMKVQDGISLQLHFDDPKNYDPTQYPDFDKTVKAGRVTLSGDRINVIRSNPMAQQPRVACDHTTAAVDAVKAPFSRVYDDPHKHYRADDARQEVHTKVVQMSDVPRPSVMDEADKLSRHLSMLRIDDPVYAGCYARLMLLSSTVAAIWPPPAGARPHSILVQQTFTTSTSMTAPFAPPSGASCFMCGGPHFLSQCPIVEDYIYAGRIVRTRDGCLAYPDGSCLHRHHGTGLFRTTIDEHFGNSLPVQSSAPTTSTSAPEFRRDPLPQSASTTYSAAIELDSTSFIVQCLPLVENNAVITEANDDAAVHAITRSKAKEASTSQQECTDDAQKQEEGGEPSPSKSQERFQEHSSPSTPEKCAPAYTYESKAMNPITTKQTFSKILDVIVPSITVGDLLAISLDL